mmetsp:Transcript_74406/g.208884  ORF Transcript_74406/g.208884 Transcript_74406/m.208884 type:complete len:208 (+) Transcript_74406:318-941(+)
MLAPLHEVLCSVELGACGRLDSRFPSDGDVFYEHVARRIDVQEAAGGCLREQQHPRRVVHSARGAGQRHCRMHVHPDPSEHLVGCACLASLHIHLHRGIRGLVLPGSMEPGRSHRDLRMRDAAPGRAAPRDAREREVAGGAAHARAGHRAAERRVVVSRLVRDDRHHERRRRDVELRADDHEHRRLLGGVLRQASRGQHISQHVGQR